MPGYMHEENIQTPDRNMSFIVIVCGVVLSFKTGIG